MPTPLPKARENPLLTEPFIDHLRCRVKRPSLDVFAFVVGFFTDYYDDEEGIQSDAFAMRSGGRGHNGFEAEDAITYKGHTLARYAYGGVRMRGWGHLTIDGQPCGMVPAYGWSEFPARIQRELGPLAELRRLDLALDDDRGVVTLDTLEAAYEAGAFDPPRGRRPTFDPRSPRQGPQYTGWTAYVGKREGAQFIRVYDKTAERIAALGKQAACVVPIDVHRVRHEVELKAVDGLLPWDMVSQPRAYFAGACPWFAAIAGSGDARRLVRPHVESEAELHQLAGFCRSQYGAAIDALLHLYDGDMGAVFDLIRRPDTRGRFARVQTPSGQVLDTSYVAPDEARHAAGFAWRPPQWGVSRGALTEAELEDRESAAVVLALPSFTK